jgi:hypothetical protein
MHALEQQFRHHLGGVERAITEIRDAYNKIVAAVNSAAESLVSFVFSGAELLWERVKAGLKKLENLIIKLLAQLGVLLREGTPLLPLFRVGFDWSNQVQGPVSSKAGVVAGEQSNLANWQGPAATAFRSKRVQQAAAVTATAASSGDIGGWLVQVASLNVNFMLGVVRPLPKLGGKLTETALDAVSIFGAIEAIDSAAEAVGQVVEIIWQELENAIKYANDLAVKSYDATKILNNKTAFPDGRWPQAVGT